jgi:3-oxoacyl-[acyl-carrier-protein] synthase-3
MRKKVEMNIGIEGSAYCLPSKSLSLSRLQQLGKLSSDPSVLRDFGFSRSFIESNRSAYELGKKAVLQLLEKEKIDPESVDMLVYSRALLEDSKGQKSRDPLNYFPYQATRFQAELGMNKARVLSLNEAGCVSLFSAIDLAKSFLTAERKMQRIICVSSDILPPHARREILYNVISDAACAVSITRTSKKNKILAYKQVTKGFYWNPKERVHELIATYFPTARTVLNQTLKEAGLTIDDIDLVIPHNVNKPSWDILAKLFQCPEEKIYLANISKIGHTIAADAVINLESASKEGRLKPGDKVLLFTFGFGAHWACMILEH